MPKIRPSVLVCCFAFGELWAARCKQQTEGDPCRMKYHVLPTLYYPTWTSRILDRFDFLFSYAYLSEYCPSLGWLGGTQIQDRSVF